MGQPTTLAQATTTTERTTVLGEPGHPFQLARYAAAKRPARRKPRKAPEAPVGHVKVNREVWGAALKAAGGDPRRIEIISATEVRITNG